MNVLEAEDKGNCKVLSKENSEIKAFAHCMIYSDNNMPHSVHRKGSQ